MNLYKKCCIFLFLAVLIAIAFYIRFTNIDADLAGYTVDSAKSPVEFKLKGRISPSFSIKSNINANISLKRKSGDLLVDEKISNQVFTHVNDSEINLTSFLAYDKKSNSYYPWTLYFSDDLEYILLINNEQKMQYLFFDDELGEENALTFFSLQLAQ